MAQMKKFGCEREEKIVGKGESEVSPFPTMFSKAFSPRLLEFKFVWERVYGIVFKSFVSAYFVLNEPCSVKRWLNPLPDNKILD